jgi:choline/glycine/proline betaine transport protein
LALLVIFTINLITCLKELEQNFTKNLMNNMESNISVSKDINKNVFFSSLFFILLITITASLWPLGLNEFFNMIQNWLISTVSWLYVLAVGSILFFAIYLMLSKLGNIKLGPDHSRPVYSNISWFSMLFSAGMGIGLIFFGVAEPMMHFSSPPVGTGTTIDSAKEAMKITFFHWGLHAWAIYAVFAVILAYFTYRKNLPLLPRSALYPFIGDKIYGKIGDTVDTFAVIGTMFGIATSLGFGVSQVNAGLSYIYDVPQSTSVQVILIAIITLFATGSVVLGLDGGIKKLSNINIFLACTLMLIVLCLGNTVDLMQSYVQNTGAYLSDIIDKTFNLYAYEKKEAWIGGWTLFYWGWWLSWAPFVGMFIARISKGRTIREFFAGVLFVPTGFTFLWMTVFGNSAIQLVLQKKTTDLVATVSSNVPVALFKFFEYFPFSSALSLLGLTLIITFFVSSSDSGSLVIDTLTSGGAEEPPVWQRVFWATAEGAVAAALLLAGGLEALQTMTIATAFPMIFMILIACLALLKSLRADSMHLDAVEHHTTTIQYEKANSSWKTRLETLVKHPDYQEVKVFLDTIVTPGLEELKSEMQKKGLNADINKESTESISLVIKNKKAEDFHYQVHLRSFRVPDYMPEKNTTYYRAEVFLRNGGQNYDVFGYTREQVVADALTQYEKHFHYLHMSNS